MTPTSMKPRAGEAWGGDGGRILHDCQWPGCPAIATHYTGRVLADHIYVCTRHMLAFRMLSDTEAMRILDQRGPRTDRFASRLHWHHTHDSG